MASTSKAARRPVVLRKIRGGDYLARGESARRLSLVTGRPTVPFGQSVAVRVPRRCFAGTIADLRASAYRSLIA